MKRISLLINAMLFSTLLFVSGCVTNQQSSVSTETNIPPSFTPTITPTIPPSATPTLQPTPSPISISSSNAANLIPLAKYNLGPTIFTMVFSPDGRWLAMDGDGGIQIFDSLNLSLPPRFLGEEDFLFTAMVFSPDGKYLVSTTQSEIVVWDVNSGVQIRTIKSEFYSEQGDYYRNPTLTISPDGQTLAFTNIYRQIEFYDFNSGEQLNLLTYPLPSGADDCPITFSRDLALFAACPSDRGPYHSIHLFDTHTGKETSVIYGTESGIRAVAFSPDGKKLASVNLSGTSEHPSSTIILWDVATGKKIDTLKGYATWVRAIAFSPDGKTLAGDNILWDVDTGKQLSSLDGGITALAFSPDGKMLAYGGGSYFTLWDATTKTSINSILGGGGRSTMVFSSDGTFFTSGGYDSEGYYFLAVRDVASGNPMQILKAPKSNEEILPVAISADSKTIVAAASDGTIIVWNVITGERIRVLDVGPVQRLAVSPDGSHVAGVIYDISGNSTNLVIWDVNTGQQIVEYKCKNDCISVIFSPEGKSLVYSELNIKGESTIFIRDTLTGEEKAEFSNKQTTVFALGYSPDGKILAATDRFGNTNLWDIDTSSSVSTFKVNPLPNWGADVYSLAFSPNGKLMAFSCQYGYLVIWDIITNQQVAALNASSFWLGQQRASSLTFVPDGSLIMDGSSGTLLIWGLPDNLLRYPSPLLQQSFTPTN